MTSVNTKRSKEIKSLGELHYEFGRATLLFSGKETDNNWESRIAFLKKVTTVLLSENAAIWREHLDKELHDNMPVIILSIHSNRSTVTAESLLFVDAIASSVASSIPIYTLEIIMKNLLKISCITKKGLAAQAFKVTNHLLSKTSFHTKIISMLCKTANEKNPQLREFSASYIGTVLDTHGSSEAVKSRVAKTDLSQLIREFIQKGLVDAAPSVREACKNTYSVYSKYWPTAAEVLCQQMDLAVRRRLGLKPSTPVTKSTKPMINRTIKSPGSIQKPGTRALITNSNLSCKNVIASSTVKLSRSTLSSPTAASSMPNTSTKAEKPAAQRRLEVKPSISKTTKPVINRTLKTAGSITKPFNKTLATKAKPAMVKRAVFEPTRSSSLLSSNGTFVNKPMSITTVENATTTQGPIGKKLTTKHFSTEKLTAGNLNAPRPLEVKPLKLSKPESTRSEINRTVKSQSGISKPSSNTLFTKANSSRIQDAIASVSFKRRKCSSPIKSMSKTKAIYSRIDVNPSASSISNNIPKFAKPTISQTLKCTSSFKSKSSVTRNAISSAITKPSLGSTTLPTPTSSVSPKTSPSISGSARPSSVLPPLLPSTSTPDI
ncbi:hypothetical protein [Parasitella parasitica]|uniref:CLASP N-terminal domain-containing protein n=1 Tax=Parasitella parasitica TaxID=35722 RepID=A0A0B7NTA2_9FUNG|nr:hypothetical protein [Parasitella parasitica]